MGRSPTVEEIDAEIARRTAGAGYRADPVAFAHDNVFWQPGEALAEYQDEILAEIPRRGRVAVRGPHALGKSAVAALLVLWFALTRDPDEWKAPTTASAHRQLSKYLWPEIHKWARLLRWDRLRRRPFDRRTELQVLDLKLRGGAAFAVASDDAATIEGAHADHVLYVFDEAKTIPTDTWDAAEGAFAATGLAGKEALALAISTPGAPSGRFYEIHARLPGYQEWWTRHVTLDEAVRAGRVSAEWAEARLRQWGAGSAVYKNRVLGEFAGGEADGVIPLEWVEAAIERWLAWREAGGTADKLDAVGVDVGLTGALTVLAPRVGDVIEEVREYPRKDTMETTGFVAGLVRARGGRPVVDVVGLGAGVFHRLRELKLDPVAFSAGAKTDLRDRSGELGFANLRAAAWWGLRERLDPQYGSTAALPPDDGLVGELVAPRWKMTSSNKILIEEKAEIARRIGRSTDRADAVVMAYALGAAAPPTSHARGVPIEIGTGKSSWRESSIE